jgi:hypothetical protein
VWQHDTVYLPNLTVSAKKEVTPSLNKEYIMPSHTNVNRSTIQQMRSNLSIIDLEVVSTTTESYAFVIAQAD